MELAKQFTFIHTSDKGPAAILYKATIDGDTCDLMWINRGASLGKATYTTAQAKKFVEIGDWVIQEVLVPADVVVDAPAASEPFGWPEIFALADYSDYAGKYLDEDLIVIDTFRGVSLQELRAFSAETGYTVEVDADFYSFSTDGEVQYVTGTDEELAEVMAAIRALVKYSDRG